MPVDAGTIYSEVRIQIDKLRGDIRKVQTSFDQFSSKNAAQATNVENNWKKSFNALSLVGVAAFVAVSAAAKNGIKTFAQFEQSIANVRSVAGGTEEEFKKIEDAAISAGESTRFTASQAADALYSLASAGLDAEESVAALDGVLKLAGATGSDLASTSASVVSTLAQYNLEAEEATRVSNVFAAAIGNSQANMEKLTAAFRQVGPVAGALNISLEETTGAIQALLDAGYQGEQAGTALRNILSSLASESDPTTQKLINLGLSFEKLDPTINGIVDVIGTLNDANLEASDILDAFGVRAGPQLLTLLSTGKKGLEDYTEAVTDTNAAAEAYAIQNDTLQGSFDKLSSAVESVTIGFVKEFAPVLRVIIDGLKNLVSFVGSLPGPLKILFGVFILGVPTVLGVAGAIGTLTAAMAGMGVTLSAVLGPISLVVGGIAVLTGSIAAIGGAIKKARFDDLEKRFGAFAEEAGYSAEQMNKLVGTMEDLGAESDFAIKQTITKLQQFQQEVGISDEELNKLVDTAKTLGATDKNIDKVVGSVYDLNETLGISNDAITAIQSALVSGSFGGNFEYAKEQVKQLAINTGLAEKAILKIGLASGNVSKEYREQLELLLKQKQFEEELASKSVSDIIEKRRLDIIKEEQEARNRARAKEEELAKQAEQRRLKELNTSKEQVKARTKLIDDYNEALRISGLLSKENLITREEQIKAEIAETEKLIESLFELGYTGSAAEETFIDANGKRVTKQQEGNKILRDLIDNILPDLNGKLKELETTGTESFKEQNKTAEEYRKKLVELNATESEKIELARQSAIADVISSKLTAEAHNEAIDAVNNYYDALRNLNEAKNKDLEDTIKWTEEQQKFLDELKSNADILVDSFSSIFGAINELSAASAQRRIDDLDRILQKNLEAIDIELQKVLEAEGLKEETRIERLQREIEAAKIAGDLEAANQKEQELKRLQITQDFEKKKSDLEIEAERKKAKINYDAAISQWNINLALAVADAARAIITAFAQLGPIGGLASLGLITTTTGIQIAAMNEAKPQPPSFKTGGFVFPTRGYQSGGIVVPSGAGGRQITVAENNSPEMMLNAGGEGAAMMDMFASRIASKLNSSGGVIHATFIMDGKKTAEGSAKYYNNGQVRITLK